MNARHNVFQTPSWVTAPVTQGQEYHDDDQDVGPTSERASRKRSLPLTELATEETDTADLQQ